MDSHDRRLLTDVVSRHVRADRAFGQCDLLTSVHGTQSVFYSIGSWLLTINETTSYFQALSLCRVQDNGIFGTDGLANQ
jgi:hypothetical protein